MKKTTIRISLLTITVLMLLYAAIAVEKNKSSPGSRERTISGKIESVDLSAKAIQMKDELNEYTVYIDKETKIRGEKDQEIKLEDLKEGDIITAAVRQEAEKWIAIKIQKLSKVA